MNTIKLNTAQAEAVKALAEARRIMKAAEAAEKAAKALLPAALFEGETVGTFRGQEIVKSIMVTRAGFNAKALLADSPEIHARYVTSTTYPRVDTP